MKLTVVKKKTQSKTTGVVCNTASCKEAEKKVESIKITAKIRIGIFKGFVTRVILFSMTTFTPHKTRSNKLPKTTSSCFGNVKKSVVIVRKNSGKRKKIVAVTIVPILSTIDEADLVFIIMSS